MQYWRLVFIVVMLILPLSCSTKCLSQEVVVLIMSPMVLCWRYFIQLYFFSIVLKFVVYLVTRPESYFPCKLRIYINFLFKQIGPDFSQDFPLSFAWVVGGALVSKIVQWFAQKRCHKRWTLDLILRIYNAKNWKRMTNANMHEDTSLLEFGK